MMKFLPALLVTLVLGTTATEAGASEDSSLLQTSNVNPTRALQQKDNPKCKCHRTKKWRGRLNVNPPGEPQKMEIRTINKFCRQKYTPKGLDTWDPVCLVPKNSACGETKSKDNDKWCTGKWCFSAMACRNRLRAIRRKRRARVAKRVARKCKCSNESTEHVPGGCTFTVNDDAMCFVQGGKKSGCLDKIQHRESGKFFSFQACSQR